MKDTDNLELLHYEYKNVEDTYEKFSKYYDFYSNGNTDDFEFYSKYDFQSKRILDVGCGTGRLEALFLNKNPKEVVGIDISKAMLDIAKSKYKNNGNFNFYIHNFENGKFELPLFDYITVSFFTINYIKEPYVFLKNLLEVLKVGGSIIIDAFIPDAILSPTTNNVWRRFDPIYCFDSNKKIDIFDKRILEDEVEKRIQVFYDEELKTYDPIVTMRYYHSYQKFINILNELNIENVQINYGYSDSKKDKVFNFFVSGSKKM